MLIKKLPFNLTEWWWTVLGRIPHGVDERGIAVKYRMYTCRCSWWFCPYRSRSMRLLIQIRRVVTMMGGRYRRLRSSNTGLSTLPYRRLLDALTFLAPVLLVSYPLIVSLVVFVRKRRSG